MLSVSRVSTDCINDTFTFDIVQSARPICELTLHTLISNIAPVLRSNDIDDRPAFRPLSHRVIPI